MSPSASRFEFPDPLDKFDPEVQNLLNLEDERQDRRIILIASESICPAPVREALSCKFSNIYAEGYPCWRMTDGGDKDPLDYTRHLTYYRRYSDLRYYKGADYANFIEALAQKRLAALFATDEWPAEKIFANVQPLSGAAANNAVYNAFARPGDTVLGLNLTHGGHLTHGSPANRSGVCYNVIPYGVKSDGQLDYAMLEKLAREHRPKLIVTGASAYPWGIDFARVRKVSDEVGAILLADIAHPAGLVATGHFPNPIGKAHVVSFTTHKTLCGPRGAALLCTDPEIAAKVNLGVFPGEQGGPHLNQIAAKAVAFGMAASPEYKELMRRTKENAEAMAAAFKEEGFKLVYGGTETHLLLIDLKSVKYASNVGKCCLKGELASRLLELVGIVANKNTIPGDDNAAHPTALRFGTTWITQVGFGVEETRELARVIARLLKACHPFQYMENSGYQGRAKLDFAGLRQAREAVNALLGKVTGDTVYPHFEYFAASTGKDQATGKMPAKGSAQVAADAGVLEVRSERAHYFAQSIGTADLSQLGEWEGTRTLLLDKELGLIDDVEVVRVPDENPGWRRYFFFTSPERHANVRSWFRAISDGYILFDAEVHRKVEGPVMVDDLTGEGPTTGGESWQTIGIYGPEARSSMVALGIDPPGPGRMIPVGKSKATVLVAPGLGEERFILAGPAGEVAPLATKLKGGKGDGGVRAAWRSALGFPAYASGDRVDIEALRNKFPALVETKKLFFVGQEKLVNKDEVLPPFNWSPTETGLKRTALFETHQKLAKKSNLVPFAGWEMPVVYSSIPEEHEAVRTTCGLFDVAHMGVLDFKGDHAERFLDAITTNYVAWLQDGQGHYSYLPGPDGALLDDILVYRISWNHYMMVVNAANEDKDLAHIRAMATGKYRLDNDYPTKLVELPLQIRSLKEESSGEDMRVDLALQGPLAFAIMRAATDNPALIDELERKGRFEFVQGDLVPGLDVIIARTGYTGEDMGVELYVHPDNLPALWDLLMEKGEPFGIKPCGLGSRDSTRTEAGFPLYGHELAGDWEVNPMESGYGSSVKFHKPFFVGREALLKAELSASRTIVRFSLSGAKGKSLIRTGHPIVDGRGRYAGVVTSCCVVKGEQIGLAIVDMKMAKVGSKLNIFALPASAKRIPDGKRIDELVKGDAVLLTQEATIIPRFM